MTAGTVANSSKEAVTRLSPERLKYRPDVDGLRAVAVLLVIAAHLRQTFLGGFVGVDIFFVISGYLISAHIMTEMREGRFRIVNFYERRVRRIFPALLVMLAGTTVLAAVYLYPIELRDYGLSMLGSMFSYSNMLFWHQAGYFDTVSLTKPLLHTWSLGVEEQFYIFFPVFLMLVGRWFPHRVRTAIWATTVVSLAAAAICVVRHAGMAFYWAPFRVWELLTGTVVSQRYLPTITRPMTRNVASAAGLLLILAVSLRYSEDTVFPGLTALAPCIGAALIIAAGETGPSWVGRLLSLRPVVWIGLISYSLYLWHWPMWVFQSLGGMLLHDPTPSHKVKLAVFVASLALGALSWRFVERPFREGRLRPARGPLFAINGVAVAALAAVAVVVLATGGLPERFPPLANRAASYLSYQMNEPFQGGVCFFGPEAQYVRFDAARCVAPDPARKATVVMGDSHAASLWPGLEAVYGRSGRLNLAEFSASYCNFLEPGAKGDRPTCRQIVDFLYDDYLIHGKVGTVILCGRWHAEDLTGGIPRFVSFAKAHSLEVVLVGPAIEYDLPLPRLLASSVRTHDDQLPGEHADSTTRALDLRLAALAANDWHVRYISQFDDLCTPGCPVWARPEVPMVFDTHHLTADGSLLLAQAVAARNQIPVQ